jgi:hypothetical protein
MILMIIKISEVKTPKEIAAIAVLYIISRVATPIPSGG